MTMQTLSSNQFHRRIVVASLLVLSAVLYASSIRPVSAHGPRDVAAPAAVAYHLAILFAQGPSAGNTLDGQINGTLDSTGMLTATLLSNTNLTATVTGVLATAAATITVQGKAGDMSLQGHGTGKMAGQYGGAVHQAGLADTGTWLLTPEAAAHTYAFAGRVQHGHHSGLAINGLLVLAAQPSGFADGTLTLDDGTVAAAQGRLSSGNLEVSVSLPGQGLVLGVAPPSTTRVTGSTTTEYNGIFAGPGTSDQGTWVAILQS